MWSTGWEVVGKNKKAKLAGKLSKLSKAEKKKFIENAPKVEDFLPLDQVKTLYDNLEGDKENNQPKNKGYKTKENEEKKKQHQQKCQQNDRKQPIKGKFKEKLSKITDRNAMTVEKINELLETNRMRFPEAPLIWLKDLVAYVNRTITQDNPDFIFQSTSDTYPLSLIPKSIRTIFERVIKGAGAQNVQLFYEGTLLLMVKNMSNESPDMGSKIFLQLLAQIYPEITALNIEKHISLRNSYQNKKSIGFALLWALSQGGKKNPGVGLALWHEVMAPMLESRIYASYVLKILRKILANCKNPNNLTQQMLLEIIEDLYSGKINISNAVEKEIEECGELLKVAAMESNQIDHLLLFENLFGRITLKITPTLRDQLLTILTACIAVESKCLDSWISLHVRHLYTSELLLKQLGDNWHDIDTQLNCSALKFCLETIISMDIKTKKGKEEACVAACRKRAESLSRKMTASPKKQRPFPWKRGSLLLFLLISAVVAYDYRNHGCFEASTTGHFVKISGVMGYAQKILTVTKFYSDNGLDYLKAISPEYYETIADSTIHYSKLAGDFYLVGRNLIMRIYNNTANYADEKWPIVLANIEEYFPGWLHTLRTIAIKVLECTKQYSNSTADYIIDKSHVFIQWLQSSVFVGKWSPENIRSYAMKAVDFTQEHATQIYDWVYEKVQTLSKIQ
ncbi:transmembrane protein 214-A [Fopius arisanus]|uniref:Transmembrane protein 214-A n=1 Tax=Fopius arisanus TaxID=64838 RepID=A0A9R1TJY3_9HYME|nr:PREDICTED: transmembrane protein 214-A [Fopius arisanus]